MTSVKLIGLIGAARTVMRDVAVDEDVAEEDVVEEDLAKEDVVDEEEEDVELEEVVADGGAA